MGRPPVALGDGMVAAHCRRRPGHVVVRPRSVHAEPVPVRDHRRPRRLRAGHRHPHGRGHRREEGAGRGPTGPPGPPRHAHRAAQPGPVLRPHRQGPRPGGPGRFGHRGDAVRPRSLQGDQRHHGPQLRRQGSDRGRAPGEFRCSGPGTPWPGWEGTSSACSFPTWPGSPTPWPWPTASSPCWNSPSTSGGRSSASRPAAGSRWPPPTVAAPICSCNGPTWPCTWPRRPRPTWWCTGTSSTSTRPTGWPCSATCAMPWPGTSSSSTTNPRPPCGRVRWRAPRPWSGGSTPPSASSTRTRSSPRPSAPG